MAQSKTRMDRADSFSRRLSGHLNQEVLTLDLDRVGQDAEIGVHAAISGLEVEVISMPGAHDPQSLDHPVGQRPPLVGAGGLQGVVTTANMEQGNPLAIHLDYLDPAFGEVTHPPHFDEFGHAQSRPERSGHVTSMHTSFPSVLTM